MTAPAETDPEAATQSATRDHAGAEGAATSRNDVVRVESPKLPVRLPARPIARGRGWWRVASVLLVLSIAGSGTALYWLKYHQPDLPPGIVWGNARLEADEIDIATKFAGRIAQLFVDEGDRVETGQVLARMDTQDLEASLKKAESDAQC